MKTGIILANFISVGTIAGEKEVLKIISSGFDRAVVKILRISTDIRKDLLIHLILVLNFHLQFH